MIRRSAALLSKGGRRVVRDPRKKKKPSVEAMSRVPAQVQESVPETLQESQQLPTSGHQPLPFEPSSQNQAAVGSSLGSYLLAGAGMAIGFSIVGAVFGAL